MKITVAAIEFGTSKIVTMIGELASDMKGETLGYGVRHYDGYTAEGWNNTEAQLLEAIAGSVADAQTMANRTVTELYVGVPAERLQVFCADASVEISSLAQKVTLDDVDAVMEKAVAACGGEGEIIHQSPAWFRVDGTRTMEPMGMRGKELSCCACVCRADKSFVDDVSRKMQAMGLKVAGFASPSLGEALMIVPPQERDRLAVLIDCGYLSTQVMIVQGDAISHLSVIDDGAGFFTAALAAELELTMALAEQVKRGMILAGDRFGSLEISGQAGNRLLFSNEQAFGAIEPCIAALAQSIRECLDKNGIEIPQKASYYLTGGGLAPMRGAREYLAARLGCTIKASPARSSIPTGASFTSSVGLLELVYELVGDSASASKERLFDKIRSIFKK